LQHAEQVLKEVRILSGAMNDHRRGIHSHVKLWASTTAVTSFLPEVLATFLGARPNVAVDLVEDDSAPVVQAVESAVADLGVFAEDVAPRTLKTAICNDHALCIIAPEKHKIARHKHIWFADCLEFDFVGASRESALVKRLNAAAGPKGLELRMRVHARSFDAVCKLVAQGVGLAVLPEMSAASLLGVLPVKVVTLNDEWAQRRSMLVGWRDDTTLSDATAELQRKLQSLSPRSR
jgi:DNA-binding transcriptional LysR family regulator